MVALYGILGAALLAGLSVLLHFECLNYLNRVTQRLESNRARVVSTMIGLLLAHIAEIWLYAGSYLLLIEFPEFGALHTSPEADLALIDLVYFSAMVYTTVGFGDIVPSGVVRLITATEALVGLSLIAWSASYTYFQTQEHLRKIDTE